MCLPANHSLPTAENEALVLRYFDMWNTGDGAVADAVLSPRYLDHAHPGVLGPAAARSLVPRFRAASPDATIAVEILGADAELVVARTTIRRSRGGVAQESAGLAVFRAAGGKLVEQWSWTPGPAAPGEPPSACDVWEEAQRRIRGEGGLADMFALIP